MTAIYKKELKGYFTSMTGFLFLGFFLAVTGIYTVALNLVSAYSNFEYVLQSISFLFILLVPILTMRTLAEEKKQKTDQLLYTVPVSVTKIVLAKFFAVLTLFVLVIAVMLLYPLILGRFGTINYAMAYGGIVGFLFMGTAYIALGIFISSLTESQVIAAVISFLTFFITYLMPGIITLLPSDNLTGMLVCCMLVCIAAIAAYFILHNLKAPVGIAVAGSVIFVVLYMVKPSFYDGLLTRICNVASISSRYDNFSLGILDISAIVYYSSVIFVSLFATILFIRHSVAAKRLKKGAYDIAVTAVVLCIVFAGNILIGKAAPEIDISTGGMYTLSGDTKELVQGLKDPVSVYYICQEGNWQEYIKNTLKQYNGLNSNLKVVNKDPVLYPAFTAQYTEEEVSDNSVIVVNETTGIAKYIPYSDMLVSEIDYTTYSSTVTGLDVEGQVTSAIQFVTSEDVPKLYAVNGHGETSLGSTITSEIAKLNVTVEDLETISAEQIPEDCDILLMNAPQYDITEDEAAMIKKYLENGGRAILNSGYTDTELKHYNSILSYYGITLEEGIILEETGNYIGNYPNYILPSMESHEITSGIEKYIVAAISQGMRISEDIRSTVTAEPLLTTSEQSYSKIDLESEDISMGEGDIKGPFTLGAVITETYNETETKLAVFSTPFLVDDSFLSTAQFGNDTLFLNTVSWMSGGVENNLSIPAKNLGNSYLTVEPSEVVFLGMLFVFVIPGALLLMGFVIWFRRRRA